MSDSGYEFFKPSRAPRKATDPAKLAARAAQRREAAERARLALRDARRASRPLRPVWTPLLTVQAAWVVGSGQSHGGATAAPAQAGALGVSP